MATDMQDLDNAILNTEYEIEYYKGKVLAKNKPEYIQPPIPVIKTIVARLRNKLARRTAELEYYKNLALQEGVPEYRKPKVPKIETAPNHWKDSNPCEWTSKLYREDKDRRRIY